MSEPSESPKPAVGYVRAKLLARRAKLQAERTAQAGIRPSYGQLLNPVVKVGRARVRPAAAMRWLIRSDDRQWVPDRAAALRHAIGGECTLKTARAWLYGSAPFPAWAMRRLADLVRVEAAAGLNIAAELDAAATEIEGQVRAAPGFMKVGPDGTNRQGRGKRAKIIRPDDAADKNRA